MKNLLIPAFIAIIVMASCRKENPVLPSEQVVTYALTCEDCLIYLEDAKWNRRNELQRSKSQYFNVRGDFKYSFTNTAGLDSVEASVSVSVLYPAEQVIRLNIFDNQGRSVQVIDTLGFSADWRKDDKYELIARLNLK